MDPELGAGSIHPGRGGNVAGAYRVSACRETNITRWLMGTRMVGAAVARRCRRVGTEAAEAAEHESENENPARRPDHQIGSQRSPQGLDRNGSRLYGAMQNSPMSLHRTAPGPRSRSRWLHAIRRAQEMLGAPWEVSVGMNQGRSPVFPSFRACPVASDDIEASFAAERCITLFHSENPAGPADRRLRHVRREIETTGTYRHTPAELEFGARVARRNSSRGIGRLYWRSQ